MYMGVIPMTYETLRTLTYRAKHLHVTRQLTGVSRNIVYHIYGEIRDGIENNKFHALRSSPTAQVTLFSVVLSGECIYVNTHYRSGAYRIWSEKCANKDEAEKMCGMIESAAKLVGLKFEPVRSLKKEYRIFMDHE